MIFSSELTQLENNEQNLLFEFYNFSLMNEYSETLINSVIAIKAGIKGFMLACLDEN
jgi:hypothetical protein